MLEALQRTPVARIGEGLLIGEVVVQRRVTQIESGGDFTHRRERITLGIDDFNSRANDGLSLLRRLAALRYWFSALCFSGRYGHADLHSLAIFSPAAFLTCIFPPFSPTRQPPDNLLLT